MGLRGGLGALAQEVLGPGKCAREGCFTTPQPPRSHLAAHENARQHAAPHSPLVLDRRAILDRGRRAERGGCSPRPRTNARHLFYWPWYVAASGTAQQARWAAVARARAAGTAAGASRSGRLAGCPGCWQLAAGVGLGPVRVQFAAAGGLLWPAGRPTWCAEACRRRAARLRQKSGTS